MDLSVFLTIADVTLTLVKTSGKTTIEGKYRLALHDQFSGKTAEMEITGENKAVNMVAAWMAADTSNEEIEELQKELRAHPQIGSEFMP